MNFKYGLGNVSIKTIFFSEGEIEINAKELTSIK
jgi:hypothetical protein